VTPLLALLVLLVLPASAKPPSCTDGIKAPNGVFCDSVDECVTFCSCACTFDPKKWQPRKEDDASVACTGLPDTGFGMLPRDSADLVAVSTSITHVRVPRGIRAIQAAADGLAALGAALETMPKRRELGFTARVGSCYRHHSTDSKDECGYVLKGNYMISKSTTPEKQAYWREKANPLNLGLAWPGRTPHSGGYACDVILVDKDGADCFDWRAGVPDAKRCSIDAKTAVELLNEAMTAAGALRLTYEAWHYEWGPSASGCVHPDCAKHGWPITGKPGNKP